MGYTITDIEISEKEVEKLLTLEICNVDSETLYIVPESRDSEKDLLNEYSPDMNKLAKVEKIPCKLVYNAENYEYLALRDSQILLPFLVSFAAGACYDFVKCFIVKFFAHSKNLKVRLITKKSKRGAYRKIELEGDADSVIKALEILQKEEKE